MKRTKKYCSIAIIVLATLIATRRSSPMATIDIPEYPGSRLLCEEHISAGGTHVLWKSFGTRALPPEIVAFFERQLKVKAVADERQSFKLVDPSNSDVIVRIYSKSNAASFPECRNKPSRSERTVILISQGIGRSQ